MTQDPERLAEIESCPSCGALPCDWCNNPHASTLKPSERGPTAAEAEKALSQEPSHDD